MSGYSALQFGTVSTFNPSPVMPMGNADTIIAALGYKPGSNVPPPVVSAAQTGFFSYDEPSCGSGVVSGPGVGSQLVGAGVGAIPIVGGIAKTLLGALTGHHAAAVKNEQATLCRAVPDANNFLRGIDAAVVGGQLDTATAAQALEQGFANWRAEVSSILKDTGGKCNAACVFEKAFRAAIEKRKQDYALSSNTLASAAQGVLGGVVDAVGGAVSSVEQVVTGVPSASALQQAGFSPARQSSLAGVLLIGGLLVSAVVFSKFLSGRTK